MHARAGPGRAVLHLPLVGLGVSDKFRKRVDRKILARDQHPRRVGEQRDVLEIGDCVVERLLVERLVDGENGAAGEEHGVAVGRRLGDAARAGHAAGAGDVLDHHLLAEDFAQARRENAPQRIDRAARGVGTTMVTARVGQSCALAVASGASRTAIAAEAPMSGDVLVIRHKEIILIVRSTTRPRKWVK